MVAISLVFSLNCKPGKLFTWGTWTQSGYILRAQNSKSGEVESEEDSLLMEDNRLLTLRWEKLCGAVQRNEDAACNKSLRKVRTFVAYKEGKGMRTLSFMQYNM